MQGGNSDCVGLSFMLSGCWISGYDELTAICDVIAELPCKDFGLFGSRVIYGFVLGYFHVHALGVVFCFSISA